MTHYETPNVAKLRHLLERATPGQWEPEGSQVWGPDGVLVATVREYSVIGDRPDAQLIAAAVNALPSLLDELDHLETDVAEAEGDAQRYWPFVERAERAEAALARVRELHMESRSSMSALYPNPLCECGKDYPCPTIAAIGGEQS